MKRDALSSIGAVLIVVVIAFGEVFGVIYGFTRFGIGDGITTILVPPYAWYRAASVIWTPPVWKVDWDLNAGNLALVLIYENMADPTLTLKLRSYDDDLHKWLKKVPERNRQELRANMEALQGAYFAFANQFWNMIAEKQVSNIDSFFNTESVQHYVEQFKKQKGIFDVWEKFRTQEVASIESVKSEIAKIPEGATSSENKEKFHKALDASQKIFDANIESFFPDTQ